MNLEHGVEQVIERLVGVRVLVLGDAMLDHYIIGAVDRISPEAPVPIVRVEREFDRVGGAANVAANIVSLGGYAELVTMVGGNGIPDADAERLATKCREISITATLLPYLRCTTRKTRILSQGQQMLRIDWEHAPNDPPHLPEEKRQELFALLANRSQNVDAILVSDYAKGMITAELMNLLRNTKKPVIVDPRPSHAAWYVGVRLITPNRKEGAQMLGLDPVSAPESPVLGRLLRERFLADIFLTLSEEGIEVVQEEGREHIPAVSREVADVTGAGDTVAAVAALGIGAGLDLRTTARLANAAAGIVVGHIGTASVTPEELRASLLSLFPSSRA